MSIKEELIKLLIVGDLKNCIEKFMNFLEASEEQDLHGNIILLSGRFHRNEQSSRNGLVSKANYDLEWNRINNSLKEYINETFPDDIKTDGNQENISNNPNTQKTVFISFSHKDIEQAKKLKEALENQGIDVHIDFEQLKAGENIKAFIEKSVRETSNTISVISKNSLMSSWVVMETMNSIGAEKVIEKKLISAFIDDSFADHSFVDNAMDDIDKHLKNIQDSIKERLEKNRNIDDLQDELGRYQDLRHNLPKVVQRIRESFSIDLNDDNFENGVQQIVDALI